MCHDRADDDHPDDHDHDHDRATDGIRLGRVLRAFRRGGDQPYLVLPEDRISEPTNEPMNEALNVRPSGPPADAVDDRAVNDRVAEGADTSP